MFVRGETDRFFFSAYGVNADPYNIFHFSPAAKKGAAQKKRDAASRTMPSARGEKNGIYDKNVRQRNVSPPILRPVICVSRSRLGRWSLTQFWIYIFPIGKDLLFCIAKRELGQAPTFQARPRGTEHLPPSLVMIRVL